MAFQETTKSSNPLHCRGFDGYQPSPATDLDRVMTDFAMARRNMVESQVRPNGITDHRIIDAMAAVAREDFVPQARKSIAYLDEDVLIKSGGPGEARHLMEPMAFARMVHLAAIKPTDRVLVVGAGTGYGAKIISMLAISTVALEQDAELVEFMKAALSGCGNIKVVEGKLADGCEAEGPFDAIILEGRIAAVSDSLFNQLGPEGRIVAAIGASDVSKVHILTVNDGNRSSRPAFDASISPLPGFDVASSPFVF
jgi:protein-L-isoaspartate(D-aspartate) O-methyltransferase